MKCFFRRVSTISAVVPLMVVCALPTRAEPLPLKRAVELALSHSTTMAGAAADEQRVLASYREARNQFLPQLVVGSGLGASWGFPLSLEGAAPSLVNVTAQSALFNPSLRDFVRAAKIDGKATSLQTKDQRNQVIQDTIVSYAELNKWQTLLSFLRQAHSDAQKMEDAVNQRVAEGVDSALARDQARLGTARAYLRITEAQGAVDVLRRHLSQLTGLPGGEIETVAESIPALPEIKADEDLSSRASAASPAVQAASIRADAQQVRARGEHRALWPSVDFASQYALLSKYNNYDEFYKTFQRHNATVGVAIRFPFLSFSQRSRAEAADAEAVRARKDASTANNQVSEETLRLERSVEQLAAARDVADLEYRVAHSNLESIEIRADAGSATLHDLADARNQSNERYGAFQNAQFELQRAHIALLRATGQIEDWLGGLK